MTPEDIRKLYASEGAADSEEARETQQQARTDPETARKLLLTLYALGGEDREFGELLNLVVKVATMQLIAMKVHEDDDFALRIAELILDGMETIKPGSKVQRGRQAAKKAKSA